jgi:hypothetical protein
VKIIGPQGFFFFSLFTLLSSPPPPQFSLTAA